MFISRNAVIVSLAAILAALLTLNIGVLLAAHCVLAAACLIDILAAPSPKSLNFVRTGTKSLKLGETVEQQITLENTANRKVRGWFRDCWPPSAGISSDIFDFSLAAGERKGFAEQFTPHRRGTRHSDFIAIRTIGPLRLAGRQRSFSTDWDLQILPAFSSRKHLPSRIKRLREMEGHSLLLVRGQGTEFDSLREYVAGDDVRAIDWRSSARLGQTLVRTWRPQRDRRIVVLLDSGRAGAMRIGSFPAFDDYIETTLLLAALAQRAGDSLDAYVIDSSVRARIRAGADRLAIHTIANTLADIAPILTFTDWQLALNEINRNSKQAALVVILTAANLSSISDGLLRIIPQLAKNHRVLVAAPQNPQLVNFPDSDSDSDSDQEEHDVYFAAAKARSELERNAVNQQLAMLGSTVVAASPEDLPVRVADTYLALKAQGQL
ncbi:DUF58 domain-containing protein [Arcanobacterium hippocoleae]